MSGPLDAEPGGDRSETEEDDAAAAGAGADGEAAPQTKKKKRNNRKRTKGKPADVAGMDAVRKHAARGPAVCSGGRVPRYAVLLRRALRVPRRVAALQSSA